LLEKHAPRPLSRLGFKKNTQQPSTQRIQNATHKPQQIQSIKEKFVATKPMRRQTTANKLQKFTTNA
jgi:hypothetical protein